MFWSFSNLVFCGLGLQYTVLVVSSFTVGLFWRLEYWIYGVEF